MNYVPLHIKTNYSLLSSMIKIPSLIRFAKINKIYSLTITDNNLYGSMEFYKSCINNNIKPIIGLEVIVENNPIILYCKDYVGYQNLLLINSMVIDEELSLNNLFTCTSGLLCIVPYQSLSLYDLLKKEFQHIFISYKDLSERSKLSGNNLVYMNEVLYLEQESSSYINYLYAIKEGSSIDEIKNDDIDKFLIGERFIKNQYPDDLKNNYLINELCNLKMPNNQSHLLEYKVPDNVSSSEYLRKLCIGGMRNIFGDEVRRIYLDRLNYELDVIKQMGFCNYFLIVWDYVNFAKEKGILASTRGSAASSLVAYCLGLSSVDPIKNNLLFERFLNPDRITMPDIDVDFEDSRREEVINYCINKYGNKRVVPIITFGTFGAKQSIRDVGRTMNISISIIDNITKLINSNLTLFENYNQNYQLKNYIDKDVRLTKMYQIASHFEGLKRHSSVHAAGIVMSNTDLDNIIPLDKRNNGTYITGYEMYHLEELGLLKMDLLGLSNFSLITKVINDINKDIVEKINFDKIKINDPLTIEVFKRANTIGIFQFESEGIKNFLKELQPSTFEDIIAANALYRPGPMNNIKSYIRRKHGQEKIDYLHESLEHILKPTYGIIIYDEQIMQIVSILTGYSLGKGDILRRFIRGKNKEELQIEKEKFVESSMRRGYTLELSSKVFDLIGEFAKYGFPKAHSVAYSTISYKMAYLKLHYSKYFMKNLLSLVSASSKIKDYIYECKNLGIEIISPDINMSTNNYEIYDDKIVYPLTGIRKIGNSAINTILEERINGDYKDIYDFIKRVYGPKVNQNIIISLIDAGTFGTFGLNRRTLHENLDLIINYGELIKGIGEEYAYIPELKIIDEYSQKEILNYELESFGFYLSNHPVTEYRTKESSYIEIADLPNYFDKIINIIVYVDRIKEINTKKNDKMVFITGSDEIGIVDIVLFPKIYSQYNNIEIGDIIYITGKVEKRFDKYQIIVNKVKKIN